MSRAQLEELRAREQRAKLNELRARENAITNSIPASDAPGDVSVQPQKTEIGEPALTVLTAAVAEPVAGLVGMATAPFQGSLQASQNVRDTREALTYRPSSEAGQKSLERLVDFASPAVDALNSAEKFLGDKTLEATESPALAAAATTLPTTMLEIIGFGLGKGAVKGVRGAKQAKEVARISKSIKRSAPTIAQLKAVSRSVYREIDNLDVRVNPDAFDDLVANLQANATKGIDPDVTPKAWKAMKRFEEARGQSLSLTEIDNLREVAKGAAKASEGGDIALGARMVDEIDDFLDNIDGKALKNPSGVDVSARYRVARDLWGRARRSELIGEAFEKARNQASGFENGIRAQFRSILNNKRQSRFFNQNELREMRKVVRGTGKENFFRLLGKFGFNEGSATNMLGGVIGVTGGGLVGGVPGAVAVPVIGQVSRKLAQRMTVGNAEFANTVIRAGKDAQKIVRAYMKHTPKGKRSAAELSELLMSPDIDLSVLPNAEVVDMAKSIALERRAAIAGTVVPFAKEAVNE